MPKDKCIKKVLVIGSGPIVIGQAAEFDYAGAQACRVLKAEGINTVLVNSNPATIMTDKAMADEIYLEPLNAETVARILEKERPDGLLAGLGGQTGLTVAMQLTRDGTLDRLGVRLLGTGIEGVRALVPAGSVAIVLGESGAGKSTLLNALLGRASLATGAVRESDDAGRHTTVARRMVSVPGGGVIVDEPGLRSLPMVGHERGLALVFPDIADAARSCRFRDCTHTHEPGCAVAAGRAAGDFSEARASVYLALAAEMRANATTLDPDVVI